MAKKRKAPKGDISSSRIKAYLECPKKFRKLRRPGAPKLSNRHKRIGSLVHDCLDKEGKDRITNNLASSESRPVTPSSLTRWLKVSTEDQAEPGRISEIMEAHEILTDIADRISFEGVSFCEESWRVDLAPGITAVGVFDLGEIQGDKDTPNLVLITDYKTGSNVMTPEDFMDDPQSALYVVAAKVRWPKAKRILVRFWWVEVDAFLTVEWSPELDEAARIHALDIEQRIRGGRNEPGTPNTWACSDCPFKGECTEYQALVSAESIALNTDKPVGEIMARREAASIMAKGEDSIRKEADAVLKGKLLSKREIVDGGFRARLTVKTTGHDDCGLAETVSVIESLTTLGRGEIAAKIGGIEKRLLKGMLAELPVETREKIEAELRNRRRARSTSAFIDVRRIGPQLGGF